MGWELVNEPIAYGNRPEAGAVYSQHMADLIGALDWGDKRLFVGGLNASAQFANLDHDLIRKVAGDRLVWSVHMYPAWVVPGQPDPDAQGFAGRVATRHRVVPVHNAVHVPALGSDVTPSAADCAARLVRAFVRDPRFAPILGLVGYASNQADGRVLVVAEGPRDKALALLDALRSGTTPGRVDLVVERVDEPRGDLDGFVER